MDEAVSRRVVLSSGAVVAAATAGAGLVPGSAVPARAETLALGPGWDDLFTALQARWPDNRTLNIVWHGHSVVAGYHLTPRVRTLESYPFLVFQGMTERFQSAVLNSIVTAIGGEGSTSGSRRFARDVLRHDPDLLFIDYAINDRSTALDEVESAWRRMIEKARQGEIPLVLLTPTGTRLDDLTDPTNALSVRAELIRELGAEYEVAVADVSSAWQRELEEGVDQETLLAQGLHPNAAGHAIAAAEILRLVDQLGAAAAS